MRRRWNGLLALLAVSAILSWTGPAEALIDRPYPLKTVLAESQLIFVAKVDQLDADKRTTVLLVEGDLKGKATFRRLAVSLKGDADAEKGKQTPQLLKRLAPQMNLVVFAAEQDKGYLALCYTNGTWFQIRGDKDGEAVRWSFNHFEPYLRRTFKGTTKEMRQIVADALSDKKPPPAVDLKEKPGIGPEVAPQKEGDKDKAKQGERETRRKSPTSPKRERGTHAISLYGPGPVFAVIPSVLVGGPLAVLAMLFPTVFGGWKRWLALISVACTVSSLYFIQWLFITGLADSWWGSPQALWLGTMLAILAGMFWAWQRQLARVESGDANVLPSRFEFGLLLALTLLGAAIVAYFRFTGVSLLDPGLILVLILAGGAWMACLYVARVRWEGARRKSAVIASEVVMLSGMAVACAAISGVEGAYRRPTSAPDLGRVVQGEGQRGTDAHAVTPGQLLWTFRAPDKGGISSSPLVDGDRVYVAVAHDSVFKSYGALYCLDRARGNPLWTFHDDKKMKCVFSSPCLADGKLFVGEGFHQDSNCKLYCLRADTGEKIWDFQTGSHTESSPCFANGKVYVGAGDDGLYCLDAATGTKVWNFPGFHVDASPVVVNGRVYVGSGIGDVYKETALFCLDAESGKLVWRLPTELPAWPAPAVKGRHVYFGIGNGRMNESDANPAGALVCVETETGAEAWRYPVGDGVLAKPVADGNFVYFGSRDGNLYCLRRDEGKLAWKHPLGAPVVAAPVVARCSFCGARTNVFALAGDGQGYGRLVCLGANEGRVAWSADLAALARAPVELISSPALTVPDKATGEGRRIYVGAQVNGTASTAVLYCFEDHIDRESTR
jgi:outer membrane protein assembly factor BamB